jgi:hypothetical protein
MKALISPNQDNFVVQVEPDNQTFEIGLPLYWLDCPNNIVAYQYKYINNKYVPYTPEYVAPPEPTKAELMAELAALTAKIQALGA